MAAKKGKKSKKRSAKSTKKKSVAKSRKKSASGFRNANKQLQKMEREGY
jgi:hypothetical protein